MDNTSTLRIATYNRATGTFVERSPDGYRFNYRTANEAGAHGCIVAGSVTDPADCHTTLRAHEPVGRCRRIIVRAATTGGAR